MKFFKKQNKQKQLDISFNEEDISLLAVICMTCRPLVTKHGFITRTYAYYVPEEEEYLGVAQYLFKKNGVETEVHFSRIINSWGQNVLRLDYNRSKNCDRDSAFFEQVRLKKKELFYAATKDEESRLKQAVNLLNARVK